MDFEGNDAARQDTGLDPETEITQGTADAAQAGDGKSQAKVMAQDNNADEGDDENVNEDDEEEA